MKGLLSPEVPLLVFYSDPAATQRGCGCTIQARDEEEEERTTTLQACECPTDACFTCGLDQEYANDEIEIGKGQNSQPTTSAPKRRPLHLLITVCMHGNEKTGSPSPPYVFVLWRSRVALLWFSHARSQVWWR
jgi:hypothetical protein